MAGCAGHPVCSDSQTTQIINAPPEKKSKVNQSINAATLLFNVGKAKAAKHANAGSERRSVRSGFLDVTLAIKMTSHMKTGKTKCCCQMFSLQWFLHVQSVQAAKGQAGQVNQSKSLSKPFHWALASFRVISFHCHKSTQDAMAITLMQPRTTIAISSSCTCFC